MRSVFFVGVNRQRRWVAGGPLGVLWCEKEKEKRPVWVFFFVLICEKREEQNGWCGLAIFFVVNKLCVRGANRKTPYAGAPTKLVLFVSSPPPTGWSVFFVEGCVCSITASPRLELRGRGGVGHIDERTSLVHIFPCLSVKRMYAHV